MKINWQCDRDYFCLEFDSPVRSLSSAILGGGLNEIRSVINLRVDENFGGKKTDFPPPEQTLQEEAEALGLALPCAGMMTAANMNSFRYTAASIWGISIYCYLTSGLSNALAAGDKGAFAPLQMYTGPDSSPLGTINIAVGLDCRLTDAAMAEVLMVVAEAKASVIFELGVQSRESERTATGTGTDSALVFCPGNGDTGNAAECYCGKHTLLGGAVGAVVRAALFESLKNDKLFI